MPTDTRPRFHFDTESDRSLTVLALGQAAEKWDEISGEMDPEGSSGERYLRDAFRSQAEQARKIAGQIEED